jgi:hypothetical protein
VDQALLDAPHGIPVVSQRPDDLESSLPGLRQDEVHPTQDFLVPHSGGGLDRMALGDGVCPHAHHLRDRVWTTMTLDTCLSFVDSC